jgi:hypothetical protein
MVASSGRDWFGPPFLSLECEFPTAGRYRITVDVVSGPNQAKVQLFRNEVPAGEPVDLYSAKRSLSKGQSLGVVTVQEGRASLMFKLVGKNPDADGWGLDLATIVCEKIR